MERATSQALVGWFLLVIAWVSPNKALADLHAALGINNEAEPSLTLELDHRVSLHDWHPALSLRLATGVLLLPGNEGDDNAALLLTPAFRYTFANTARRLFIEAGIGAALFLNTHYEDRRLGSSFQFEDRLAAGMRVGNGELSMSLTHYSNADIRMPNHGLDILAFGYRHPF